ncbi:MAG: exodeoxyribonuclease III [Cyanobacteria bacterium PR.3.49]|jgi:exodeoxyribonuclease-3|nr:exodeoxyribonuclease III [Cyanobacteria bacterium PR.3.49]
MILATWNVNSLNVRLAHVVEWLKTNQPDVLAIQETKLADEKFPKAAFAELGYAVEFCGEKTYNGVAIVSRKPIENVSRGLLQQGEHQQCRLIEGDFDGVRIVNVYIPNGQEVGSQKYEYKLSWLDHLYEHINKLPKDMPICLLGDFNIAPADDDVYDPIETRGTIMVSEVERTSLDRFRIWGLSDAFRELNKEPKQFSWWDYRMAAFRRNLGYRIDHIWVTSPVKNSLKRAWIDKAPRKLERPSDHTPVIIEF